MESKINDIYYPNDINASFEDLTTLDGNRLLVEYTLEIHLEYASIPHHSRSPVAKSVGPKLDMTTYSRREQCSEDGEIRRYDK